MPALAVELLAEARLEQARQRDVDVVAAEQQVIADREPFERQAARRRAGRAIRLKSVVPPPMSITSARLTRPQAAPPTSSACAPSQA